MKSYRFLIALSFLLMLLGGIIGFSSNGHQTIPQERSQIDYKQRESRAPAEVKKRLLELREQIKARNLTFEVDTRRPWMRASRNSREQSRS